LFALDDRPPTPTVTGDERVGYAVPDETVIESKVEETGTGDFNRNDTGFLPVQERHDCLRDLSWWAMELPGKYESGVGRQVSMYKIRRSLNPYIEIGRRPNCGHRQLERLAKRCDSGLGGGAVAAHSPVDPFPEASADLPPAEPDPDFLLSDELDSDFLLSDEGPPDR
jgi:hypothetical protein